MRPGPDDEGVDAQAGFTIIEMVVALTLMASVLLSLAFALYGAMGGLVASRQRSAFVEIANAEMENLRALSYESVGVASNDTAATYDPGPTFQGRDAVIVDSGAPAAVSTVTTSPVLGITLPYRVRRWVTWTDTSGGTAHQLKRINVEVEWTENGRSIRKFMLTSLLYPGGGQGLVSDNQPPVAVIADPTCGDSDGDGVEEGEEEDGGACVNAPLGTTFSFDGSGSSDPDAGDSVVTYSWNFGDGFTGSGSTVSHAYATPGNYTVTLTVIDSRGRASSPATRDIGVGSLENSPPTASFDFGPSTGTAPVTATFTSTSTDNEGAISTWAWDWGDGTAQGNTEQATHVFESAGTFTVTLTVTDSGGLTSSTSKTIVVDPLNCDTTAGSFMNAWNGAATPSNDIKVKSNNEPSNTSFSFTATTNAACTAVTARLPFNGDIMVVTLGLQSDVNGTKTWTGNGGLRNKDRFNLGIQQNATMTATSSTATDVLTYAYNVHK